MSYETNAPTLAHGPVGRVEITSRRAHAPKPDGPRPNWPRIGAWTTGLVLSAAVWAGVAMGIVALV